MQVGNGIDECDCCGRTIKPGRIVWLEFDQRIQCHHDFDRGVPEEESLGLFPFGPACAARLCREARAAAAKAGIYLGRPAGKVARAIRAAELAKFLRR